MMSAIASGLGILLKVMGLADWATKMFEYAQAKRTGEVIQKGKDDAATVKADEQGAAIDNQVAGQSDAAVAADLSRFQRK